MATLIARVKSGLDRLIGSVLAVLLAVLLCLVLANVVARYAFHASFLGQEDLAIWLHLALISLGMPLAFRGPLAMRFDVLNRYVGSTGSKLCAVAADCFTVIAAMVLAGGAVGTVASVGGVSPTLGFPEWIRFTFVIIGAVLLVLLLILERLAENKPVTLTLSLLLGFMLYWCSQSLIIETEWSPSSYMAIFAGIGILCGAPVAHAFLAAASIATAFGSSLAEPALVSSTVNGMSRFLLLAIPFFLLAGSLLTISGAAERLVTFAAAMVGHRRGGLAQTVLLTSVIFSGASGSSVANAAFGASTFQPQLVRNGYPPAQAGAIIAASSVLDNVIPPSIAFLLLAAATNLSVGSLLTGGFVAGGLMALCLAIAIRFSVKASAGAGPKPATARERLKAAHAAIPAFGLGIIVVFGIRFGLVTPTEAAALAAGFTFLLALLSRRPGGDLVASFRQSALEASAIGLLIGSAAPFAFQLAVDGASDKLTDLVHIFGSSPWVVLLIANFILLIAGLILDIGAAILLMGPILVPAVASVGINPIYFGVILVVNLMIHGLTPPLGILVYVVSGLTGVPPSALFSAVLPYLGALLIALAVLCAGALLF